MWFPPINLYSLPKQRRDYENHMNIYTIDFETYYDKQYSLSKLTYDEYINDDRFEVICAGLQCNDGPPQWISGSKNDIYEWLCGFELHNHAVCIHNALFDASILAFYFGIRPKIILDTLSMARAIHGTTVGNSLKRLSEFYGIGAKGEEVHNFIGYRRKDFSNEELVSYAQYCTQDVNLTKRLFNLMKPKFQQSELKLIDMTIRMYTEPQFMYDREFLVSHLEKVKEIRENVITQVVRRLEFAEQGVYYPDEALIDIMGGISEEQRTVVLASLRSNPKFAALLILFGVEPPMKISATTGNPTYALAKTDQGMKDLLEHPRPIIQALAAARLGVKSSLEETRTQRLIDTGDRNCGYLPIGLNYYGARTGRWSATQGLQFQNLPNKSDLKQGVIPPPGHVIIGADLSNIELRVGLWFAGQIDKLKLLHNGIDLYKDFASSVFNVAYDDVTKDQRFIGKTSQLSLIYGTGANKLRGAIKTMSGTDIGEVGAKRIVDLYREEYYDVASMWRNGSDVLYAIRDDFGCYFGYNDLCVVEGGTGIRLPSGQYLTYPNLRQQQNGDKSEWVYDKNSREIDRVYGAKVFQGTVQALARCVIGEAMVRINKRYPIALTLHDAIYLVVQERYAEDALKFVEEEMTRAPSWLPGIVLGVEGHIGHNLKEV